MPYMSTIEESHAFASDNIPLKEKGLLHTNQSITRFFFQKCKRKCLKEDCQFTTYITHTNFNKMQAVQEKCLEGTGTNCSLYESNEIPLNYSSHAIRVDNKIVTRTETQVAIPLVSFFTEILSTFGFWLGLSVSGFARIVRQTWAEVMVLGDKIKIKQRLKPNERPVHQQFNLRRQSVVILVQRSNTNVRKRH